MSITKLDNIPKILVMHLGGIIIECYIKYLIVKKTGAIKEHKKKWYDRDGYDFIKKQGNIKKQEYINRSCGENPLHNFKNGIEQINELNDLLTDNIRIKQCIEHVYNPLGYEKKNFIDLRYEYCENIQNLEEIFESWNKNFLELYKWLRKNEENIEVKIDD